MAAERLRRHRLVSWLDAIRERRDREWVERWDREHRWVPLGTYNSERQRGLVHTPEWVAFMAEEQRLFDAEMKRR